MKRWIIVTTDFAALHKWEEGAYTKTGDYLRYPHRHKFFVTIKIAVEGAEREIEFHEFKNWVEDIIRNVMPHQIFYSCERYCDEIAKTIRRIEQYKNRELVVRVSEDNENSGEAEYEKDEPREEATNEPTEQSQ